MPPIRFAIWAAVSSKAQAAADKISLPHQEQRAREVGALQNWRETTGPFIVRGESRTQYISLNDAENDIPELRAMLNAAQRHEFDVLIAYDTNRFRNLLKQVYWALSDYGAQLYFVTQPVPIQPPDQYDPSASDTLQLIINVAAITSDSEMSQIRRRYKAGMPKRITEKGLPAQIPWGYKRPILAEATRASLSSAVPEQDPQIIPFILHMKDMLLSGRSAREIIAYLDSNHIPSPRGGVWSPSTVLGILRNPYYAGYVRWGVSRVVKDRRNQIKSRQRKTNGVQARGKHTPLWDDATLEAILQTVSARTYNWQGRKNNEFTGMLQCGVCGASMWRYGNGPRHWVDRRVWRCSVNNHGHVFISHTHLVDLVVAGLQATLPAYVQRRTSNPLPADTLEQYNQQITALQKQRARLEAGYLAGMFTLNRFQELAATLDDDLLTLQRKQSTAAQSESARALWLRQISANLPEVVKNLPAFFAETPPGDINHYMRDLLENIVVHPPDDDHPHHSVDLNYLSDRSVT